jgi:hypothetical protein
MKNTTQAQSQECSSIFNYLQEAEIMVCAFDSLEDYIQISPIELGYDASFIKSLCLPESKELDVLDSMHHFQDIVNKDYSRGSIMSDDLLIDCEIMHSFIAKML